jgi:hypothetical protein
MNTLNNLNHIVALLEQNAAKIGITAAGLFGSINTIIIMMSRDNSPAGRQERWTELKKIFLCAGIIAGIGALVGLFTSLGGML